MKDLTLGPFTHHYEFRKICRLATLDSHDTLDFDHVDCPECATWGVLQGATTKRYPAADPYAHHYMLSQFCALAGPDPATLIHFEKVDCPVCTSLRRLHEEAMERVLEEIEMGILQTFGTLDLTKINPHDKDEG